MKRNNLIFYGIPNEPREKEHALIGKVLEDENVLLIKAKRKLMLNQVKELIRQSMRIRREVVITTASRM